MEQHSLGKRQEETRKRGFLHFPAFSPASSLVLCVAGMLAGSPTAGAQGREIAALAGPVRATTPDRNVTSGIRVGAAIEHFRLLQDQRRVDRCTTPAGIKHWTGALAELSADYFNHEGRVIPLPALRVGWSWRFMSTPKDRCRPPDPYAEER